MTDIVERLHTFLGNGIGEDAANEIESLRQQLAEAEALRVCADHDANELAKQLTKSQAEAERYNAAWESSHNQAMQNGQAALESQAREKVLRDALKLSWSEEYVNGIVACSKSREALAMPSDSTALDSAIKQAKREALLEAADYANTIDSPLSHVSLCRMAVELK